MSTEYGNYSMEFTVSIAARFVACRSVASIIGFGNCASRFSATGKLKRSQFWPCLTRRSLGVASDPFSQMDGPSGVLPGNIPRKTLCPKDITVLEAKRGRETESNQNPPQAA